MCFICHWQDDSPGYYSLVEASSLQRCQAQRGNDLKWRWAGWALLNSSTDQTMKQRLLKWALNYPMCALWGTRSDHTRGRSQLSPPRAQCQMFPRQDRCLALTICKGIEYRRGHCELWTRPGGARRNISSTFDIIVIRLRPISFDGIKLNRN